MKTITSELPIRIPSLARNKILFETRPTTSFIKNHLHNKLTGVEIGVQEAKNSFNILTTLDIKKLYLVDPYWFYEDVEDFLSKDEFIDIKIIAHNRLKNHSDKIEWVEKTSMKSLKIIPNNLDFVYIDGNHLYNFVKDDIAHWIKKIRVGGVLGGHDIDRPGVIRAFSELIAEYHKNLDYYIKSPDWWVVKKSEIY